MKKLEKPKFFTTPIWGNMSILFGIIITFSFSKKLTDVHLVAIILLLLLALFLWNLIKYVISWHKFYNNYFEFYKKFEELESRYNKRMNEIENKELLINEYEKFIETLNLFIITALASNSEKEIQQLKNIQNLLFMSAEHLSKMKG